MRCEAFELTRQLNEAYLTRVTKIELPMKTISRGELKQKIDRKDNFILVETLPETAYHHAHLPGAINLPPDKVSAEAPNFLPNKGAESVVYCASPT